MGGGGYISYRMGLYSRVAWVHVYRNAGHVSLFSDQVAASLDHQTFQSSNTRPGIAASVFLETVALRAEVGSEGAEPDSWAA